VETQARSQEAAAVADAVPAGDLLQFITYEAEPPVVGDPSDPTSEVRRRFGAQAAADALTAADLNLAVARDSALADVGSEEPAAEATVQVHGQTLGVALQADELLDDFVGFYAIGGWGDVRSAADQLLALAEAEAARAGAVLREAGRPADPQRSVGTSTSDRSGYPPTQTDVANAEAEVQRWNAAREAVHAVLAVLASAIVDALAQLEQHVDAEATLRANRARAGAGRALARYQPVRFYKATNDLTATPIWGYRFADAEGGNGGAGGKAKAAGTGAELRAFVEPVYARVEQVRDAELALSSGERRAIKTGDTAKMERAMQELAIARPLLAAELAHAGRSAHPWAVPLALSIPRLADEELAGCLYAMAHDIIDATEKFAADKVSLVATLRTEAVWPEVLRDGPEQALLDRLPDDGETFEPLASPSLVAASVAVLERGAGPFAATVALHYRRGLADTLRRRELVARAVEVLGWVFNLALMFVPGGALPALLEGALFAHGAIQGIRGLLARDEQFRAVLTGTVIEEEWLDWLVQLGALMAERPTDPGLVQVLLAAGVPLSQIAGFVTRVDLATLQWLDHVMTIASLL
jgi:hypothetical protein